MSVSLISSTFNGVDGVLVNVEVDIARGMPSFTIVGLPDTAVKESKERVRAAIVNTGYDFPLGRITINLAPADLRKVGSNFDLSIAIGILIESGQIPKDNIDEIIMLGELSLNGEIRRVKGALCSIIEGLHNDKKTFIIPKDNLRECTMVEGGDLYGFTTLKQVIGFMIYRDMEPFKREKIICENDFIGSIDDVCGQESAKRALVIAAAGNHNIILQGPPGAGKTMLAKGMMSILPPLTIKEALEVTKIYSVCGLIDNEGKNIKRPFRSPHHSTTMISVIGGGRDLKPGEVTLAHNGVLFLDELLEFDKKILESMREPLENGEVNISRNIGSVKYPSNFLLIGAFNPCPCGNFLSEIEGRVCTCSEGERIRYQNKLSKPMMDRIDLFSFVRYATYEELTKTNEKQENKSKDWAKNILKAREIQLKRLESYNISCNSQMNHGNIKDLLNIDFECDELLKNIYEKFGLSARALDKIIKVSRTIADLEESDEIKKKHIYEAINYRKNIYGEVI